MSSVFEQLVEDLADEHRALERVLGQLSPDQWELPTHAPGWAVRDQVAHLAHFDEAATLAMRDREAFRDHFRKPENSEAGYLARGRELTHDVLFEWWKQASSALVGQAKQIDPATRIPWAGPDMSGVSFITARLMECWSHGLDVVDVVGIPRPDGDRLRHVAFIGVRARAYSFTNHGLPVPTEPIRVSLLSPSGQRWEMGEPGEENVVEGSASDFCRVVTRRRHIADSDLSVRGEAARAWMDIAQAYAGPPGPGRQPGEFPREQRA